MKKILSCIVVILFLILLAIGTQMVGHETSSNTYTITEPYVYPLERGSEEWLAMQPDDRRNAYQVPSDIINNMTTEALLQTVITNPYFSDIWAYSPLQQGAEVACEMLSGFAELLEREDLPEVLEQYKEEFGEGNNSTEENVELILLKIKTLENILELFQNSKVASVKEDSLSNTGVTLVFQNSTDAYAYEFDNAYGLQQYVGGVWCDLEQIRDVAITTEAHFVLPGQSVEHTVDWEKRYGCLEPGKYRICKRVDNIEHDGEDYNTVVESNTIYVEFSL